MAAADDIQALISGLEADRQDVLARSADKAARDQAATAAQVAADNVGHDLDAARAHMAADLEAAIAKLKATYGVQLQ